MEPSPVTGALGAQQDQYTQLKYVLFSWKNSPILRKDPLAKNFFNSLSTQTLPSLLGAPLSLVQASLRSSLPGGAPKPPELFLSAAQTARLKAKLAETQGETRANQSWKKDADVQRGKLVDLVSCTFGNPATGARGAAWELERRLEELKILEDEIGTRDSAARLEAARRAWEASMAPEARGGGLFFALDVETWEMDHLLLTEFGWSSVEKGAEGKWERVVEHVVVKENAHRRNGRYCPDARDHFDFGTTRTLPQATLLSTLTTLISSRPLSHPLYLIMHDPRSDLQALQLLGIPTASFSPSLPLDSPPTGGIWVLDTQDLYCGLLREKGKRKLEFCADKLGVPTRRLHNAANDAKYSLDVFERLMARDVQVRL